MLLNFGNMTLVLFYSARTTWRNCNVCLKCWAISSNLMI
jgi:hypothetical protein